MKWEEQDIIKNLPKKKTSPLVSVIVPAYNVENYIKQCVDSILNQTYKNIEVICIDDGSQDNTLEILRFLEQKDDRVTLIQLDHRGVSYARNQGLNNAKGKYISFVDADDFLQFNSYEILVEVAEKYELDLIIFGGNVVGDAPKWVIDKLNTRYKFYPKGTAENVVFEEDAARPFLWLHFIKRELFENGDKIRFNESMEIGEDQLCQFEYVPRAESVMIIDDKLYNYRIDRNGSLMQLYANQRMKKFDSHIILITNVIEAYLRRGMFNDNQDQLLTWMVTLTYWELIRFPKVFQPEQAQKVVAIIKKYDIKEYCIDWYEREHLCYINEIAQSSIDESEEMEKLIEQIKQERYEIQEILKSRAFKLGRILTPKGDRLDMKIFESYIEE